MQLEKIYSSTDLVISFEVFPPKSGKESVDALFGHLHKLKKYNPSVISVTYGAGGSSRDKNLEVVMRVQNEFDVSVMPHFTCVGSTAGFIKDYLRTVEGMGVENILALRGDPPKESPELSSEFSYANELIAYIRKNSSLSIAAAAYPEGHPESPDRKSDIDNLRRKVDEGASLLYTQLFFDNKFYFSFVDELEKAHIEVPVIPGILPISDYSQLKKMTAMCSASVPPRVEAFFARYRNDKSAIMKAGIEFASEQVSELITSGVPGIHFYTLNSSEPVSGILDNIL